MTDWHKSEEVYIKKAQGENLIGFQKVWTPQSGGQVVSKEDLLSHADFGKVMYKWHSKTNAVSECALNLCYVMGS
jgi:Transcription factor/nuclear export subunit protein 2